MIDFTVERYCLANGLTVLLHVDKQTPLAVVNVLYKVGSRDEDKLRTGFAHLFEHLMFAGSANAPDFDSVVQLAGGENNAFTNTDVTNYYINLPAINLEVALWLEADRMQYLNINETSLEVQRKVVVEEFKQRYLNKPYGDVGHLMRSMIYQIHPYRWPTIGLKPEHIEQATLEEVKKFYQQWYNPQNAILSIVGNIDAAKTIEQVEYYFGNIPSTNVHHRLLPVEPKKKEKTFDCVEREVPASALYMAFLMPERTHPWYCVYDMISDILGNGPSSRLYQSLVKEKKVFQSIQSYIAGSIDKGFLMIEGKIHHHYTLQQAEEEVWNVINYISEHISDYELQKVKNKYEAGFISNMIDMNNRAEMIAFYEYVFGDYRILFDEIRKYHSIDKDVLKNVLKNELVPNQSVVLYYQKKV